MNADPSMEYGLAERRFSLLQKAAYIQAQAAAALIEAMGMQALSMQREKQGYSMAYDDEAFFKLIDKYGISHNAVLTLINA